MTVTATSYTPLTYNGNGSTTVFNVTFQFFELAVYHIDSSGTETLWVENTHYTVTGGEGSTGSITVITTLPATGEQLRIERRTSKDQPRDYDLDNAVLEAALQQSDDRLAMILQELDYDNRRRPAISKTNFTAEVEFPTASTGSVLSWGSDGNLANTALVDLDGVAISALSTTASLSDTDLLPLYDNSAGDNAAITWANVKTAVSTALNLGALASLDTVDTDQIQDNAVTLDELEHGTSGDILYYGASGEPFRLAKGTDDQVLQLVNGLPAWSDNAAPILIVKDEKSSGTMSGGFPSGTYRTRTLNTVEINTITGASLSTNRVALPAGTYDVWASAPAYRVDGHIIRLRNLTDSSTICLGTSQHSYRTDYNSERSWIMHRFTLAASKTIELQHKCGYTNGTNGFGSQTSQDTETYAIAMFKKVA